MAGPTVHVNGKLSSSASFECICYESTIIINI